MSRGLSQQLWLQWGSEAHVTDNLIRGAVASLRLPVPAVSQSSGGALGRPGRRDGPWAHPCPPQILERLNRMCGVGEQMRKKQQRLLKNMDAHKVMLDLLQIPYDKVPLRATPPRLALTTRLDPRIHSPLPLSLIPLGP